jgi:hypothetical protein
MGYLISFCQAGSRDLTSAISHHLQLNPEGQFHKPRFRTSKGSEVGKGSEARPGNGSGIGGAVAAARTSKVGSMARTHKCGQTGSTYRAGWQ